jgi:RHS repeat-associated protein
VHEGHRSFDSLGRLASEVDAFNHSTQYHYDAQGNRTEVIDPLGRLTRTRYDALLRANEIEQPNPNGAGTVGRIRTTLDAQDQIRALTDPLGLATVYSVDGLGNPTEEHSPDRGRISQSFDTAGNPLSRTDARGISATHRYDALNRLVETRYPDQLIQYHYDAGEHGVGRLTRLTDQTGETRWRYDRHGRVIERRHTSAFASLTTNYHYDAFGRMSGMTYPSGLEVDYDLDPMGRIRAIRANGQPIATDIDYHPWGIPTTWRWADGSVQRRELDPAGRIVRFTLGDRTHELSYNPAGEIIGQSDGGTFQQSYAYDGLSRLTSFIDTATTQSFSYDLNGNRQTKHLGASQTTYQYAPGSNRLSASSGSETKNYAYTAAGDLERMSTGGTSYRWTYGGDGRMKFLSKTNEPAYFYYFNALGERTLKAGSSYAYDEAGHLIGDYMLGGTLGREILWLGDLPIAVIQARPEEAPHDSPTRTGTWTLAKQPLGASLGSFYRNDPGTGAATAQWAIPQTIAGRYRLYARWVEAPSHSAAARYTVIHAEGTNVISADQRQNGGRWYLLGTFNFTPGANHRVVLTDAPDGAVIADAIKVVLDNLEPSIGNIHTDHLGTPRLIEDHSGKTIWRWDHLNPFGANPANEDPDGDGVKVVFNLRFPGQVFDKETGMHYNYFRDYDSATGRYLQADPIGLAGGINPYLYAEANPVSWTDPLGLKTMQCTKPLNALGPKWGPVGYKYGPLLYHQYSCVVDKNGKVTCGGQDRGENGEGKPSNDVLNPPGGKCKETQPDNDCFEQCLITEWAKPRPKYGIPFGTDCQEYDDDVNARCRKQCKIKK